MKCLGTSTDIIHNIKLQAKILNYQIHIMIITLNSQHIHPCRLDQFLWTKTLIHQCINFFKISEIFNSMNNRLVKELSKIEKF